MTADDAAPPTLAEDFLNFMASRLTDHDIELAVGSLTNEHDGLKRAQAIAEELLALPVLFPRLTAARSRVRSAGHELPPTPVLHELAREPYLSFARALAKGSNRDTGRDFPIDVRQLASQLDRLQRPLLLDEPTVERWIVEDLGPEVSTLREASRGRALSSSEVSQPRSNASVYGAYLASLWWRHLVVAAAVGSPPGGNSEAGRSVSHQRTGDDERRATFSIPGLMLESRDLDVEQRGKWARSLESFFAYVHDLAQSGDLNDIDQYKLDFNLKQLYGELDNPDGASGLIVRKYMARILAIIHSRLDDADLAHRFGEQGVALTRAVGEAEKLAQEATENQETEVAARVAEEFASALAPVS